MPLAFPSKPLRLLAWETSSEDIFFLLADLMVAASSTRLSLTSSLGVFGGVGSFDFRVHQSQKCSLPSGQVTISWPAGTSLVAAVIEPLALLFLSGVRAIYLYITRIFR